MTQVRKTTLTKLPSRPGSGPPRTGSSGPDEEPQEPASHSPASPEGAVSVEKLTWRHWPEFAPQWEKIHAVSPQASYFLSRAWVDCWLATFGERLRPDLLVFRAGGETVGCCLLVCRTQWRRGIPLRRVYLNCSGEDESESTFIEFNSLLTLPEFAQAVADKMAEFLRARGWDELSLPGTMVQPAVCTLASSFAVGEVQEVPSRYIDFASLRAKKADFMSALSSKTRYHIRRTQRAYEEIAGKCALETAADVPEALAMFRQMSELNQARWRLRGTATNFNSPSFLEFHENLIQRAFESILLFRLRAGSELVGILYCFLFRGWVYFYQSGFCYTLDRRRSPGLLTLYHAITNCEQRHDIKGFDLMAGDSEYKRSLAADSDFQPLRWILIRRRTPLSLLYLGLRSLKRGSRQVFQKPGLPQPPESPAPGEDSTGQAD